MISCHDVMFLSLKLDKMPNPDPELQIPTAQSPISGQNIAIAKHVVKLLFMLCCDFFKTSICIFHVSSDVEKKSTLLQN